MNQGQIRKEIGLVNIPLHPTTIYKVLAFMNRMFHASPPPDLSLKVVAAVAIICETDEPEAVVVDQHANIGITIQDVMRHTQSLPRSYILATIEEMRKEMGEAQFPLEDKIKKLKQSYDVFKAHEYIFSQLNKKGILSAQAQRNIMAFCWIIFLNLKTHPSINYPFETSSYAIKLILQDFFEEIWNQQEVSTIISHHNQLPEASVLSNQKSAEIRHYINQMIQKVEERIQSSGFVGLQNFQLQTPRVNLLLIQLSRLYEQQTSKTQQPVNEATFLRLKTDITPLPFQKNLCYMGPTMATKINFDSDEDFCSEDEKNKGMNKSKGSSPIHREETEQERAENKKQYLGSRTIMSNQKCPSMFQEQSEMRKNRCRPSLNAFASRQPQQDWITKYLQKNDWKLIQEEMESFLGAAHYEDLKNSFYGIQDEEMKNQEQMDGGEESWVFFLAILKDLKGTTQKQKNWSEDASWRLSLICLGLKKLKKSLLSKYAHKHHINLIGCLSLMECLKKIQTISLDSLYRLQKSILTSLLWENDEGYELLCKKTSQSSSQAFQKLEHHTSELVKQICGKQNTRELNKAEELIKKLFQEKCELFAKNKLQSVIVCALLACLSINQAKNGKAITSICEKNQKIRCFCQSGIEETYMKEQGSITLLQYYNIVFLPETRKICEAYLPISEKYLSQQPAEKDLESEYEIKNYQSLERSEGSKMKNFGLEGMNPQVGRNLGEAERKLSAENTLNFNKQNGEENE